MASSPTLQWPTTPTWPVKNHSVADFRGAAESDLRAQQRVFADLRSVADLHQVVDLYAASDAGFADAGAVDAGVRLDFDIVFDDDRSRLRNLVPAAFRSLGEAKAIGADHDAVLQQHVVAEAAVLAHHGVRVREEVVADLHSAIDDHVRQQHGAFADLDILVDHDVRANVSVRVQSSPSDARPRSDARPARSAAADETVRGRARKLR